MKNWNLVSLVVSLGGACFAQDASRSPGWVVIPVNEYGALRAKAVPVERAVEPTRVEATLTRVDYELRLDGAVATGSAALTVDVLQDGWVRVPIPAGLLVGGAKLEGQPVSLVAAGPGNQQFSAMLSRKGRSVLVLDLAFPVVSAGGEQRLTLPAAGSAITRATVTAPGEDVEMTVNGGLASRASATNWVAYARGNEALGFTFRKKKVEEERRVELPLRTRGSLTQLFGLGEDSTSVHAEVEIEVVQGSARQVRIATPENVSINQVPGATVAEWEAKGGELTVTFLEPVESSVRFGVIGESRLGREGVIDLPLLRLLDCERETGGVAVEVIGAGEIKDTKPQGLEPADGAELGQLVAARQSPALAAFRARPGAVARALRVEIARYAQQAVLTANIEEARYQALLSRDGKALVKARYAVRNNQRNFVRVSLPPGAVLWSAAVGGRPVRPGSAPDGSLLVPLVKGGAADEAPLFAVEVVYLSRGAAWAERGRAMLALPAADLQISRSALLAYVPPVFRVTAEPGGFHLQAFEPARSPVLSDAAALGSLGYRPPPVGKALALPAGLMFPEVGPWLFLASELTEENKRPTIELSYQREKQGGTR